METNELVIIEVKLSDLALSLTILPMFATFRPEFHFNSIFNNYNIFLLNAFRCRITIEGGTWGICEDKSRENLYNKV